MSFGCGNTDLCLFMFPVWRRLSFKWVSSCARASLSDFGLKLEEKSPDLMFGGFIRPFFWGEPSPVSSSDVIRTRALLNSSALSAPIDDRYRLKELPRR